MRILSEIKSADIAFFAVIDGNGVHRFHTNPDLIGSKTEDRYLVDDILSSDNREKRITLGTGEQVFEYVSLLHLAGKAFHVRLVLHTYRADAVIKRAKTDLLIILALIVSSWVMGFFLYRFTLRAQRHRLEMAKQESLVHLGTMGAVLAHEVRNPLAGIKGYAQLLKERHLDGESKEYAEYIVTEAIRLEQLVSDLLAYARTEDRTIHLVTIEDVLTRAIVLTDATFQMHRIEVHRSIEKELTAFGDEDRLLQVVLNVMQNAAHSMPDGGMLTIDARRDGGRIVVVIGDTGCGIKPSELETIFEPFVTTKARGSGLGLAICKKYLNEMRGTIEVSSMPGKGSEFRISLPAA